MRLLLIAFTWLLLSGSLSGPVLAKGELVSFDAGRNRIIAYILSQTLPNQHFSHAPFGNTFSEAAFDLYLRQLDPRKRFLLETDVQQLKAFADYIDDELNRGRVVLPDAGMEILNQRVTEVAGFVDELLQEKIDPFAKEYLESDPKKIEFAANEAGLRERWRQVLRFQVLDEYLNATKSKDEDWASIKKGEVDAKMWSNSLDKVKSKVHRNLDRIRQETRQDHYDRYFDAVCRAYDPHTNYMPPDSKEDFDIHMSGSLEGIGALLREEDGLIKVVRIIPGSAAERQGQLMAEDTIIAVSEKDGEPVEISDMRIREAVNHIRGPKGTEVQLTVQRPDGSRLVIPIVRDVVQIEETYVKSALLDGSVGERIGYIRIPSFYRDFSSNGRGSGGRNVTDDTRIELEKLKNEGIAGLILDLRNNGGGALTDAVEISGLFLPGGPVVQVKNSQDVIRVLDDQDAGVDFDGPMVVLVNQFSASASEILAAALQDYGRAMVVGGEHTHGKGTVQALVDLNQNIPLLHLKKYTDLGAMKLTIQKFYRINGNSTQFKGVEPDLVVPSMLDYLESGEKYMDYALPWDQVSSVAYGPWHGARLIVDQAVALGKKWVADSAKFQKIKQESEVARKRSKETEVVVSLDGMIRDREELERARKEMKAAGLESTGGEDEEDGQPESKDLLRQLEEDPFVQVSVFVLKNGPIGKDG